ncbi:MAG: glutathione-disulfide reductase [PS1 clade bacterium]|nr:glutathione-disulfide reductase [PS1 clade bacterium]MBL6783612.1 glutathione-disulfide reductase [PS1 clade bacterium]
MNFDYDLFVIGAGSGGVRAARMSASHGAKVAVAEEYRVGGTCVIRGCVPKKLFVYASQFAEEFEDASGFGWTVADAKFDWATLVKNKDAEIDRLNSIYIKNLKASGVEILEGRATVKDAHTVSLSGRDITAKYILVAVGATPFMPQIDGIEHAISSNEAFHIETLPQDIIIVGGGYIAVEFAGIFNGLGVNTTLVYRGEQILRGFDNEVRDHLAAEMTVKGVSIKTESDIAAIAKTDSKTEGGFTVTYQDGSTQETGLVMYATGRVPMTQALGLENAGVALGKKGEVKVDARSKTNIDSIYAVGDVTERAQLTPVAIREGAAFAETVFNDNPQEVDHSIIPTAVFSQPPIGTVGMGEEEAGAAGHEIDVYAASFRPMKNTLSGNPEKTLMKLIVDRADDKVLGLHIVGPDSGEMIQAFGVAITMGATKAQFDATIAVHPTAAEELVTFKQPRQKGT